MDALIITSVIVVLVAIIIAWVVWSRRRGFEARLDRVLAQASSARAVELTIPDGIDGQIHIPQVLRTAAGFVVVDVVRVDGAVFGAARMDEWRVLDRGRSLKFRNPAVINRDRVRAVQHLLPGLPVHGVVVLLGNVEFPKGRPDGVVTLDTVVQHIQQLSLEVPAVGNWDEAWFGLAACATNRPDAV